MSLSRIRDITENAYGRGQVWESSFRKTPALASTQSIWSDLSGAPGNPRPNYYVGAELTFTPLGGTDDAVAPLIAMEGMCHGAAVAPKQKYLHKLLIGSTSAGVSPAKFYVCDYLGFYPLVDMDSTDTQDFVNTLSLPRYTDGVGVQAMLIATNPFIGGAQFYMDYVDSAGVSRQSGVELSNTSTFIGATVHSGLVAGNGGPFIRLAPGSRGIRSASRITFLAPNGGLAALVLVKPLALAMTNEVSAYAEIDYVTMKMSLPPINDGAYLNMICCPNGSFAAAPINGILTTIWN